MMKRDLRSFIKKQIVILTVLSMVFGRGCLMAAAGELMPEAGIQEADADAKIPGEETAGAEVQSSEAPEGAIPGEDADAVIPAGAIPGEDAVIPAGDMTEEDAQGDYTSQFDMPGNLNGQNYIRWSKPMYSYIFPEEEGFIKAKASDDGIRLVRYDSNLNIVEGSEKDIAPPLPKFGGLCRDDAGNYYAFFGQDNEEKSDSKEVIRVVKYNSSFEQQSKLSLSGINTKMPFRSGCLRCAFYGKYMYVRTSHRMYSDHQANLTFQIRTEDMTLADSFSQTSNLAYGYVSHSFNQYILVDDAKHIAALDHGDAYPRSVVAGVYAAPAGSESFGSWNYTSNEALKLKGNDNASGAALGGFEYSSTSYLAVGSSVDQDTAWNEKDEYRGRNIFVAVIDRDNVTAPAVVHRYTGYKRGGSMSASAPQLVKLGSDDFLLMWNVMTCDGNNTSANGQMCYMYLDGQGKQKGDAHIRSGYVTDCHPVPWGDGIIWFADNGSSEEFYTITPADALTDPVFDTGSSEEGDDGKKEKDQDNAAELIDGSYYLVKGSKAFIDGTSRQKKDKSWKVSYSPEGIVKLNKKGYVSGKKAGKCTMTVTSMEKDKSYSLVVEEPEVVKKLYVNKGESAAIPVGKIRLAPKNLVSSKSDAVEVSEAGIVTALNGKKSAVTYRIGTKKYRTTVFVCDQKITGKDSVAVDKKIKLRLVQGAPGEVKWSVSDTSAATVDEKGVLTGKKKGNVKVFAKNNGRTVEKEITVSE